MSDGDRVTLTRKELQGLISESVHETLQGLGIEPDSVHDMQRDFIFLRELRMTHDKVKSRGLIALVTIMIGGFVTLLVMGLRSWITGG